MLESPKEKLIRIFGTKEISSNEKIIEFTKSYCLPQLIDSKELKNLL